VFTFNELRFNYQPYPIGLAPNFLPEAEYDRLAAAYPAKELFEYKPALGNKYSLSEVNNAANYERFVSGSSEWSAFREYVKGDRFIPDVLQTLSDKNIDLALGRYQISSRKSIRSKQGILNRLLKRQELSARFEFSMMDAQGGYILPHTDAQNKIVTLVVSMMRAGEWNTDWGGGTEIVWPLDESLSFNRANRYLPFDQVKMLKEWPLAPNQCVVFVKTFNSWHAVAPMRGGPGAPLRRTLTINIEAKP
jgi:hypothetical protein